MDYLKYTFKLTPDELEFREILIATLGEAGFESFAENENTVEAFISSDKYNTELVEQINFDPIFNFSFDYETIPDQNWNEVWEKNYFKPLIVADKCVIRAPFHTDFPKKEIEIVIEPNMAFGTGNHETTTMMMEFILESNLKGKAVLDMGCGTGILSILASKCGAVKVTAIDIDKWSFEGTSENSVINGADNIISILGGAYSIPDEKYDLILANIHKNIIVSDLSAYFKKLNVDGAIIVSGFYEKDLPDVENEATRLGLKLIRKKVNNNWCSVMFAV